MKLPAYINISQTCLKKFNLQLQPQPKIFHCQHICNTFAFWVLLIPPQNTFEDIIWKINSYT